jgi:hypothetical protein
MMTTTNDDNNHDDDDNVIWSHGEGSIQPASKTTTEKKTFLKRQKSRQRDQSMHGHGICSYQLVGVLILVVKRNIIIVHEYLWL